MEYRLFRLVAALAVVLLAIAPEASAQFTLSSGRTGAPRIGFAYSASPEMGPDGKPRLKDFPVVVSVDSGSSAQKAGIAAGDVILEVNGKNARENGGLFRERAPGTKYQVRVRRGTELRTIDFVFQPMAPPAESDPRRP